MTEMSKNGKRAAFSQGRQRAFPRSVKADLNITWREMANMLDISARSLTDWAREELTMSYKALKVLSKNSGIEIPDNVQIKDRYWYTHKRGEVGGKAVWEKYGEIKVDEEYRKKKWYEWWNSEGKYRDDVLVGKRKDIRKPPLSKKLAEFVGIVLGDGGITDKQVVITLHKEDDEKYGRFIVSLVEELFNVSVSVCPRRNVNACDYVVSSMNLVEFCTGKLGLKKGSKVRQQVKVPDRVIDSYKFKFACLRGLIDTDGSVYKHCYTVGGTEYSYNKLSFCNRSLPILEFVYKNLQNMNFLVNIYYEDRYEVRLEDSNEVVRLFEKLGSHNPKHTNKFKRT